MKGKAYTPAEDEYLRQHYADCTDVRALAREMSQLFGTDERTKAGILIHARKLGLLRTTDARRAVNASTVEERAEKLTRLWKRTRIMNKLGLTPPSRLKTNKLTGREYHIRSRFKKAGYIVRRYDSNIYYSDDTPRKMELEDHYSKQGYTIIQLPKNEEL